MANEVPKITMSENFFKTKENVGSANENKSPLTVFNTDESIKDLTSERISVFLNNQK